METANRTTLFILSGSLRKDASGVWHTTMWGDASEFPVCGDRLRIEAGALLYKNNPETQIVVLGGCGTLCGVGAPAISSVMKRELVELGVPAEAIVEESKSGTTMEQVQYISSKFKVQSSKFSCAVLSNKYHLPRIAAMLGDFLAKLLGAEDVLLQYESERWRGIINAAEHSSRMAEIKASEARGVEALERGVYKF